MWFLAEGVPGEELLLRLLSVAAKSGASELRLHLLWLRLRLRLLHELGEWVGIILHEVVGILCILLVSVCLLLWLAR